MSIGTPVPVIFEGKQYPSIKIFSETFKQNETYYYGLKNRGLSHEEALAKIKERFEKGIFAPSFNRQKPTPKKPKKEKPKKPKIFNSSELNAILQAVEIIESITGTPQTIAILGD